MKNYWTKFYKHFDEHNPSTFAKFVEKYLEGKKVIYDLGCGNGRDSEFFASKNYTVWGIDKAITGLPKSKVKYIKSDITKLKQCSNIDVIYLRFVLHSVNLSSEKKIIKWSYNNLKVNGILCIEVRTIEDELCGKGKKISDNEWIGGTVTKPHYRRFLDPKKFKKRLLEYNFKLLYCKKKKGWSPYHNDNPTLLRIIAQKNN